ncbi:hypothetical protein P775_25815 [Puniceibacterium antarcticum]|uniref:Bacterial sugar transferase domain-containing protein n=1 Tax=Puniceibacterium antarcticum TaxID=1206336 RepID=A0A2G8R363_9RHOB|nr:hypothetical protein P775_25815 [Puniceibacterium antarcticum]
MKHAALSALDDQFDTVELGHVTSLNLAARDIDLLTPANRPDAPSAVAELFGFPVLNSVTELAPVRPTRMARIWRAVKTSLTRTSVADLQQRFLDITVSAGALLLLSPLLAITALAIKADSRGPVLFKQTRVGRNGTAFTIFKFRSMSTDAEARRAALIATSDRDGVCFKSRTDPRVTRVGRFIRRFSIDELPQILNVLRGDMAIVGPRPALPCEVAAYPQRAHGRLAVKPGITGVWQVSGRATIGFDQMVEMDLSYAATRTLQLDLFLIAKTFGAVFSGRGAY